MKSFVFSLLLLVLYIVELDAEFHRHIRSVESLKEEIRAEEEKLLLEEQEHGGSGSSSLRAGHEEQQEMYIKGEQHHTCPYPVIMPLPPLFFTSHPRTVIRE